MQSEVLGFSYQTKRWAVPGGALELSSAFAMQFQTQIGCGMEGRGQSLFAYRFTLAVARVASSCVGFSASFAISALQKSKVKQKKEKPF